MFAKKVIIYFVIISVLFSVMIVPVSAADVELLYEDILPAAGYTKIVDGVQGESASVSPTYFFQNVNKAGWIWDARAYEHTYSSIIFTIYANGNINLENADVFFSFFNGRRIQAEMVARVDTYYYQYRVDYSSNLSWVTIDAEFPELFTGNFAIHSCIAIRDVGFNIESVYWQQWASMVKSGETNLTKELVASGQAPPLPIGRNSKRTDVYQTWFEDIVTVAGGFGGCSALESLTILGYGFLIEAPTLVIMDASTDVPLYVLEEKDLVSRYSTTMGAWGANAWQPYFWQLSVDLTGYDLEGCEWELSFSLDPLTYQSGMSFTSWTISDIIARLPVENTPWYKVFYNWLSVKFDNLFAGLRSTIQNAANGGMSQDQMENAGQEAVDDLKAQIPADYDTMESSFGELASSFSYEGTSAVLRVPALTMPAIQGIIPATTIWSGASVDFEEITEIIPPKILLLVRSLFTIALIVYCFKELYDTIAYVMTLRRSE